LNLLETRDKLPLFPIDPLPMDECLTITEKLKRYLKSRNLGMTEFFQKLDTNKDGLITIDELCNGIQPIVPIPQYAIERFFAAMDK
jgi:Ca2+-binding EF-hand superfamily protein